MAADIVVEVAPDVAPRLRLANDPVGPAQQPFVRIAAPIFALAAMEADIGDRPRGPARRRRTGHVVGTEGDVVLIEEGEDLLRDPALLPELEDVDEIARQ